MRSRNELWLRILSTLSPHRSYAYLLEHEGAGEVPNQIKDTLARETANGNEALRKDDVREVGSRLRLIRKFRSAFITIVDLPAIECKVHHILVGIYYHFTGSVHDNSRMPVINL